MPRRIGARQAGEVRARWTWTEPAVWTDRMLTALEQGVKGGKWHSLIDKVYSLGNLRAAFARVKANRGAAGVDHQTIEMFERRLESNLERLQQRLRDGTYRPSALRRVVDTFFGGSLRQAVAAHLAQRDTDIPDDELKRLAKLVRQARQKGK